MYIDAHILLSGTYAMPSAGGTGTWTGQDLSTAAVGPNWSTNYIDTAPLAPLITGVGGTNTGRNMGGGYPGTYLYILVTGTMTASGGASTCAFDLYTTATASDLTGTTAIGSQVLVMSSGAIAKASLTAKTAKKYFLPRTPSGGAAYLRYVGLDYQIATNNVTSVYAVVAFITNNVQDDYLYAAGFTVA